MITRKPRHALTLFQIMIITSIVAVLAVTIVPQLVDSATSAKDQALRYHLQTMRSKIKLYKRQHNGQLPEGSANLKQLTVATDSKGTASGNGLADRQHPYGPYIQGGELPVNPLTGSNKVRVDSGTPGTLPTASPTNDGGWIYRPATGELWVDSAAYLNW